MKKYSLLTIVMFLVIMPNTYADSNRYELYPKAIGENPILVNKETGETWSLLTVFSDGKIKEIYWRPIPYQVKEDAKRTSTDSNNSKE